MGSLVIKNNGKKDDIVPFRRPPPLKGFKKGHLLFEKMCKLRQMHFCDNIAYVWGSWLSLRSFTIVDYQSQILHIKPPYLEVSRQI